MKKLFYFLILSSVLLVSCSKNDDPVTPQPVETKYKGVYIVNEGLYGQNNSSISYYDFETQTSNNDVYSNVNSGLNLGDTANDIDVFGDKAYIAVDISNKIEIIDMNTFKSLGNIDLGASSSPRDVVILDSTIAYVTCLAKDALVKFNPSTKQIIKTIPVGSKPEAAVYSAGKIYVTNSGYGYKNTVSVVDITTDTEEKVLTVGYNPRFAHTKNDGYVYIVCSGQFDDLGKGGIYKISTNNNTVVDSLIINSNPGESCLINNNKMVVANNAGLLKVNLSTMEQEGDTFVSSMSINSLYGVIYSLSFDSKNNLLYCGNPKDFLQNGEVVVLDLNGSEIKRFDVGINPGCILIIN